MEYLKNCFSSLKSSVADCVKRLCDFSVSLKGSLRLGFNDKGEEKGTFEMNEDGKTASLIDILKACAVVVAVLTLISIIFD